MNRIFPALFLLSFALAQAQDKPELPKHKTESGLEYQILKEGKGGENPALGDKVKFHYKFWLANGTLMESSHSIGKPLVIPRGAMPIVGLKEGLGLMTVGAVFKFYVPSKLGFGKRGWPGKIPADTDLVYEVELLAIEKGEPLPEWRDLDPDKCKTSESGLKSQMIYVGKGETPGPKQLVQVSFAVWNAEKRLIICTQLARRWLGGRAGKLQLAPKPEKFLAEAMAMMKEGSIWRFVVPPELCWGANALGPDLPANSVTFWELRLDRIITPPAFTKPHDDVLTKTKSGLMYQVVREGEGKQPKASDSVRVFYSGWLETGELFDSAYERGVAASFAVGRVIKGWQEGLQLMKEGAVYRFVIPAELAYGANPPPGGKIPPNATLIFLVELLEVG